MKYKINIGDVEIRVVVGKNKSGSIESNLHSTFEEMDTMDSDTASDNAEYEAAVDGLESLILACACNGIKIDSKKFILSIEIALEAIANNYG